MTNPSNDDRPIEIPLLTSRRRFLTGLGVGAGALAASAYIRPSLLFGSARSAEAGAIPRAVIVDVFLRGAADGLSFVSPLGDPTLAKLRGDVAIPDAAALPIDARFGMHPAMTNIAALLAGGRAAFVPASGSPDPIRSHFSAQANTDRGTTDSTVRTGWLGRYLAATVAADDDALRGVGIGNGPPPSLRGSRAIATPDLASLALRAAGTGADASTIHRAISASYGGANNAALRAAATSALSVIDEVAPIVGSSTPPTEWRARFRTAFWPVAELLAKGYPIEVATIDLGGWDMHHAMGAATDPNGTQYGLVADLDAAIGAFFDHIGDAAARTTVIIHTEFGRRIAVNGSGGTDHGRGMVTMVLGAGVNPGVHGAWPGLVDTDAGDVKVVNDHRRVVAEVLARRGRAVDLTKVFPGVDVGSSTWFGVQRA